MKKITLLLVVCLLTTLSYGQISATGNWSPIGVGSPIVNPLLKFVANDLAGGDGALDGALQIDIQTTGQGEGIAFTFDGTMTSGETYNINTFIYSGSSATYLNVYLYNLTDGVSLTTNPSTASYTLTANAELGVSLSYTVGPNDIGDKLQLRYVRTVKSGTAESASNARDFFIDNVSLNTTDILPITVWNGTAWTHGTPTSLTDAVIAGNYNESANITAKSLSTRPLGTTNPTTIIIPSGYTVTLSDALIRNVGTFSLENGAKLIQTSNVTNTGDINVKVNSTAMARLDYTLWSTPVNSTKTFYNFSSLTLPNRFYGYNTTNDSFDYSGINTNYDTATAGVTKNLTTFAIAKGYAVRAPDTNANYPTPQIFNAQFTGVPNNGPINIAILNSGQGFNLVGNPYPSPISASTFVAANSSLIDGTLYFFSHNAKSDGTAYEASSGGTGMQYATWNGTGATAAASGVSGIGQNTSLPSGIIQTGQGFIVKATNAGNLSFTNAMRVGAATNTTTDPFFKMATTKSATASIATEKHRLWLNLTNANGEGLSQLLVGYVDGATNEADNLYDGEEFGNPKTSLTSLLNGKNYTIQGRALPFADTDTVPLAFKAATNGTYTIALNKTDGIFAADQEVLLKDNATGTLTNLKTGGYTFTATAGTANSRFELAYSKSAINAIGLEAPITAVKKQGVFQINTNGAILKDVAVYDMQGHEVLKQQNINSTTSSLTGLPSTRGVLIIKATTDANQTQTIKIIN